MHVQFKELRYGTLVSWCKLTQQKVLRFPNYTDWQYEPLGCVMEVDDCWSSDDMDYISLSCVNGCNQHTITRLSSETYDKCSTVLKHSLLECANFNAVVAATLQAQTEVEIDMDAEVAAMLEWIMKEM